MYDCQLFGKSSPLGDGLLATRDLKAGEVMYTILETGKEIKIVPIADVEPYSAFHLNGTEAIVAAETPKPSIFFLQHHDVGNIKVRVSSPTHA